MTIKTTTFETEEEFARYLFSQAIRQDHVSEAVEHERAHALAAKRLGYNVKYCIDIIKDSFGIPRSCEPYVLFKPIITNPEHVRIIASAPTNLSPGDKKLLENLK